MITRKKVKDRQWWWFRFELYSVDHYESWNEWQVDITFMLFGWGVTLGVYQSEY